MKFLLHPFLCFYLIIFETSGTDVLEITGGVSLDDLTFERFDNVLGVRNNTQTVEVLINDYFLDTADSVEEIHVDGEVLTEEGVDLLVQSMASMPDSDTGAMSAQADQQDDPLATITVPQV